MVWLVCDGGCGLVDWATRSQRTVAGSTAESETLAVKDCWTRSSFLLTELLEQALKRCIFMSHDMDSDAGRRMIEKGVSGAMRYARKHSGLSIAFLHDIADTYTYAAKFLSESVY